MAVNVTDRRALISSALDGAGAFGLRRDDAIAIARRQIEMIRESFRSEAAAAGLDAAEQDKLANRAFLNPYIFEGAPPALADLVAPL